MPAANVAPAMEKFTNLAGVAAPLPMINVDTDMIIPKQFLKTIKRTGLGKALFHEMRTNPDGSENPDFVLNKPAYKKAQILVAGANFGCGSSREHAPWALLDFGIRCVIAPSFADIFFNNCFKNGILPIVLPQEDVDKLMDDAERGANAVIIVDLEKQEIRGPDGGMHQVRHRSLPQAVPAQRLGRYRPDAQERDEDFGLRGRAQAADAMALFRHAFGAPPSPTRVEVKRSAPLFPLREAVRDALTARTEGGCELSYPPARPATASGPKCWTQTERVLGWFSQNRNFAAATETAPIGGAAYEALGTPAPDETIERAKAADAVLFGAVGGPQWDALPFDKKPERGLLRLRKDLDLFANLRPALCFDALKDASSSLKPEIVSGLDILIVRELTGGVYFGEPKEITELPDGQKRAVDTQIYTTHEIERIARVGFELARLRGKRVASAEKSNVMVSGVLWRELVTKVHAEEFSDVALTHVLADNCAMQLVRNPKQFDVIVTDNLFGDVLSDEAAQLTGSIGMLPSASLGAKDAQTGRQPALYEPVHGSAPDIAEQGLANPLACILSLAMCLRYSFARVEDAVLLEKAVEHVLAEGYRTTDIMQPGMTKVGTSQMTDAVLKALGALRAR